mmetsp:Transcript_15259/g.20841  ORF Transcript_15259/g.20841 Transcript_15259/m.20841 type:complete len:201 (-) Transcript_15259:194-796(-)
MFPSRPTAAGAPPPLRAERAKPSPMAPTTTAGTTPTPSSSRTRPPLPASSTTTKSRLGWTTWSAASARQRFTAAEWRRRTAYRRRCSRSSPTSPLTPTAQARNSSSCPGSSTHSTQSAVLPAQSQDSTHTPPATTTRTSPSPKRHLCAGRECSRSSSGSSACSWPCSSGSSRNQTLADASTWQGLAQELPTIQSPPCRRG